MDVVTYSQLGNNGRLGNQLFQIAATIAYGLDFNKRAVFPEWNYNQYMRRPLITGSAIRAERYNEPNFHYDRIPEIVQDVDLHGYFQSWKYFDHYRSTILDAFTFNQTVWKFGTDWMDDLKRDYMNKIHESKKQAFLISTCSIHVRRGDYVSNHQTNAYHGALGMDYYKRATCVLPDAVQNILFIVLSDDIAWCKENFTEANGFPHVIFSNGNPEIIDLFIQTKCRYNVIANSSFSWWGHYLNQHPKKLCVAPERWFAGAGLDTKDLYLPQMIKI